MGTAPTMAHMAQAPVHRHVPHHRRRRRVLRPARRADGDHGFANRRVKRRRVVRAGVKALMRNGCRTGSCRDHPSRARPIRPGHRRTTPPPMPRRQGSGARRRDRHPGRRPRGERLPNLFGLDLAGTAVSDGYNSRRVQQVPSVATYQRDHVPSSNILRQNNPGADMVTHHTATVDDREDLGGAERVAVRDGRSDRLTSGIGGR